MITSGLQRQGFTLAGEFINPEMEDGPLRFHDRGPVPKNCGAYAWVLGDEVVYVGSTTALRRRVREHTRKLRLVPRSEPGGGHDLFTRKELRAALARGQKVEVFIAQPGLGDGNGLDVCRCAQAVLPGGSRRFCRFAADLETQLIKQLKPRWNLLGNMGARAAV